MPYTGSGYRRDKATGEWLSPEEQQRRRDRRTRIAKLVAVCSADDLQARIITQRAAVGRLYAELKSAEERVDADKAMVHAAVDKIARISRRHGWLKIYAFDKYGISDYQFLSTMLPSKSDQEPYYKPALKPLDMLCVRASVEGSIKEPSLLSRIFGWSQHLREFRNEFPALERAISNLNYVPLLQELRARGVAANAERHELIEALEQRQKSDAEAERKRQTEERRRYEKARLAAIDDKTRQGVNTYRQLVDFTGFCAYCEAQIVRGVNAHLDHIMPVAKGGINSVDNLVWACDRCNLLKSDKSFHRFCKTAKLNPDKVVSRLHAMNKYV